MKSADRRCYTMLCEAVAMATVQQIRLVQRVKNGEIQRIVSRKGLIPFKKINTLCISTERALQNETSPRKIGPVVLAHVLSEKNQVYFNNIDG